MTKTTRRSALIIGALTAMGVGTLAAQEDVAQRDGRSEARRGVPVEAVLAMHERLELTDEQIASLDVIRSELVAWRSTQRAEAAEMRSRLAADQIRRSEMMAFTEERRDAAAEVMPQYRERLEAVLSEAQLETLRQEIRTRTRTAMRRGDHQGPRRDGRRNAWRGPRQQG